MANYPGSDPNFVLPLKNRFLGQFPPTLFPEAPDFAQAIQPFALIQPGQVMFNRLNKSVIFILGDFALLEHLYISKLLHLVLR